MDESRTYGFFFKGDFDHYYLGHQFQEIFKQRVYKPYLEGKKDAVVIDVGGNLGLFSLYAQKYAKQVYCIEPSSESMESIERMLAFNEFTNIKPIKKAVFTENGTFPLFDNQNRTMRSLHSAIADQNLRPELVETITLEQLFKDEGIEHVDLLKVDIEGTEIELFSHPTFRAVAPKIDVIVTERHAWAGRHANQLDDALKSNGFEVLKAENDADIVIGVRKTNV